MGAGGKRPALSRAGPPDLGAPPRKPGAGGGQALVIEVTPHYVVAGGRGSTAPVVSKGTAGCRLPAGGDRLDRPGRRAARRTIDEAAVVPRPPAASARSIAMCRPSRGRAPGPASERRGGEVSMWRTRCRD